MKFLTRAAILAAATFCAGALANAATPQQEAQPLLQQQDTNAPDTALVPPAEVVPAPVLPAAPQPVEESEARFQTLSAAVAAQDLSPAADRELNCLAVGVYYESKGEPLAGQLAVAEVILDRTTSGRFPRSVCSVLTQRGQFSFVRGGQIPTPPNNEHWRKAMAVAKVAQKDLWESPVDGALYFHARHVSPRWKRPRAGTVGNHVFYR